MASFPKVADGGYQPAYQKAAVKIAELIATANLKPGDRLPTEHELCEQLGVSRTVVREAVKVLVATGQVQARKGSGLYVAQNKSFFAAAAIDLSMPVDPSHISSLFELRFILETETTRLAAERATPKELHGLREAVSRTRIGAESGNIEEFGFGDQAFHMGIAHATRNPFLVSAVSTINDLQDWVVDIILNGTPGSLLVAAEQHATILSAIEAGDGETASAEMRKHIQTTLANYELEVRRRLVPEIAENERA